MSQTPNHLNNGRLYSQNGNLQTGRDNEHSVFDTQLLLCQKLFIVIFILHVGLSAELFYPFL